MKKIDDECGFFIKEFHSIHEAERQTGINKGHITSTCKGKLKTAGKHIWKYKKSNTTSHP